ncbi:aromatic acid exporter family protein [Streptomyces sp. NPDC127084]|uniref:FUSC family protein n=1 Tax=Streptomyces sp. NPDC127084 TaxID=3347133 RepID=UPI003664F4E6
MRTPVADDGPVIARITVTATVAWQASVWLGADQPPVFAALVPVFAMRGSPGAAVVTSLSRVLGVVAGVLLGIGVLNVLRPQALTLALVVGAGLLIGAVLRPGGELNVQVAVSALLVFANPSPGAYGTARVWETAVGAVATVLLGPLLWPPDPRRVLRATVRDCGARLARALTGTVAVLGTDPAAAQDNLVRVRKDMRELQHTARESQDAERLLAFNPWQRRHREAVRDLCRHIAVAAELASHVQVLAREAAFFTPRPDTVADLVKARRPCTAIAAATARAIELRMEGGDAGPAIAEARGELDAFKRATPRPAAVALRRPFQRILDDLDDLDDPDGDEGAKDTGSTGSTGSNM